MQKHKVYFLILLFLIIFIFLFSGCVKVDQKDRLDTTNYFDNPDAWKKQPDYQCTCMLCYKNSDAKSWFERVFATLLDKIGLKDIASESLTYTKCGFFDCTASGYVELLDLKNQQQKQKDEVWKFCKINDKNGEKTYPCVPRFFMLGFGPTGGDYFLAQRFCEGRLNLPIRFISPINQGSKIDIPAPSISWLSCSNLKSQIPLLIYRSLDKFPSGQEIDSDNFKKFVSNLQNLQGKTKDEEYYGPVFVTTEALADPYYIDSNGNKKLNITLLEKINKQLKIIKDNCQSCITVLALKPTFNETGDPDLCPLDYFLDLPVSVKGFSSVSCQNYYPSYKEFKARQDQKQKENYVDVIGVGFIANEYNQSNITSCTPSFVVEQHVIFSKKAVYTFQKPVIWYLVGMSEGPTKQEDCEFTAQDVAIAYKNLIDSMDSFRNNGIIGIGFYQFMNSYFNLPMPCTAQKTIGTANIPIKDIENGKAITDQILVNRVMEKNKTMAYFEAQDGFYYLAYSTPSGEVILNKTGCQFGFKNPDNTWHNNASAYFLFSNCQYYFTNKGVLFYTSTSPSDVRESTSIESENKDSNVFVAKIDSKNSNEVKFYDNLGASYLLRTEGNLNVLYQTIPKFLSGATLPLIFSKNTKNKLSCTIFSTGGGEKLYSKKSVYFDDINHAFATGVQEPTDPEVQKTIAALQCGNCLAFTPIPKEICEIHLPTGSGFEKIGCDRYPQMDIQFLANEMDPIFMRAVASIESGLDRRKDETGPDSPACAMSKVDCANINNCGPKTFTYLKNKAADSDPYCSDSNMMSKIDNLDQCGTDSNGQPVTNVCAMGVMQCINTKYAACGGENYNPFNPYDSACCGANKMKAYLKEAIDRIKDLRNNSQDIREEISEDEIIWYAAMLAGYSYNRGPGHYEKTKECLLKYNKGSGKTFASYFVLDCYKSDNRPDSENYYGLTLVRRYNTALQVCNAGCPFNPDCEKIT